MGYLVGVSGPHADGAEPQNIPFNAWGNPLVNVAGGKYLDWARRGYLYVARSGAAAAIPVNTTCTNAPTLWNPADSGKTFALIRIAFSAASLGTQVIDGFTLMYESGMSDTSGTAGMPFPTFTNIAPVSTLIGKGGSAKGRFANGTVTWTTQPAVLMDMGMGQWLNGTAANGECYNQMAMDFDGLVLLPPGSAICVGAATAASSATYWTSIVYAELPTITY